MIITQDIVKSQMLNESAKKSPSAHETKKPLIENSNNEEYLPVVERPPHYWVMLYARYRNYGLKETLSAILNYDMNIYREILERFAHQSESVVHVAPDAVETNYWVLSYNKNDKEVAVVLQDNANDILQDWICFEELPHTLPNGTVIKSIKMFDQLLALMTQFNPYWLLEVAAYALSGGDFSRVFPNRDYSYAATPEQIIQIRATLTTLLNNLEQAI